MSDHVKIYMRVLGDYKFNIALVHVVNLGNMIILNSPAGPTVQSGDKQHKAVLTVVNIVNLSIKFRALSASTCKSR